MNSSSVRKKLPAGIDSDEKNAERTSATVSDVVLDVLALMRGGRNDEPTLKKRRMRIVNVVPGKIVSPKDLSALSSLASSPSTTPTPTNVKQRRVDFILPESATPTCSKKFYSNFLAYHSAI